MKMRLRTTSRRTRRREAMLACWCVGQQRFRTGGGNVAVAVRTLFSFVALVGLTLDGETKRTS